MNKTLKLTTALGTATVAMAFAVTAASADTTDLVNTGDNADVNTGSSYETDINVDNRNDANIHQFSYSSINTGNNDSSGNIGGGNISTGNALVVNEFDAQANNNQTTISGLGGSSTGGTTTATITNTGDDLDFDGGSDFDVDVDVDNDNDADVHQSSIAFLNTGDNDTDDNIGGGDIDSGNAGLSNEFSTQVNHNKTTISGLGFLGGGDNNFDFVNTGDDADVEFGDDVEVDVDVDNDNDADVHQSSFAWLNTGDNDTDDNIGGGDIDSGDALVDNMFSVMANGNETKVDLAGLMDSNDNELEVVNTGDDLEVESGLRVETSIEVESDNESSFYQKTITDANTGDNDADDNIGGGDTDSGSTGVWADFMANANWNWTKVG